MSRALAAARSVNAGEVARANPGDVATALRRARTEAIARVAASSAPA